MNNYLLDIIERTASYLESRMRKPVNLDDVSSNVNVSKFHLLRIWKGATSTGIMEYVRRRRLALSLADLLQRSQTIDFVSSIYLFGSERAYNRAFKEEFGMTPTRWRRAPAPLNLLERFNAAYLSPAGNGLLGAQTTRALPGFMVAGIPVSTAGASGETGASHAIQRGIEFFYERRKEIENPVERDVYLGLTTDIERRGGSYLACLEIGPDSITPPEFTVRTVGPFSYAIHRYMGAHDPREIEPVRLELLWDRMRKTWESSETSNLRGAPYFERIDFSRCSRYYCECDIYLPVRALSPVPPYRP